MTSDLRRRNLNIVHDTLSHYASSFCEVSSNLLEYRIVLKYWDTQRIGTSLKIVKIIILADPKYWTILRKRKNIRNFSDPKNWDGVLGPQNDQKRA